MQPSITFHCPPRVLCANGARHRIAPLCRRLGWRSALLVTDPWFVAHSPELAQVLQELRAHGIAVRVFDGGQPDPSTTLCDAATAWALSGSQQRFDHLIAWGGGSNIDLAKALSVTLACQRPVAELVGCSEWPAPALPLVAVPTTAGTGTEITPGAILVQPGSATKVALMSNVLRPAVAVIDPELTWSCPATVTAEAGVDALTHAVESWLARDAVGFEATDDPDPSYSGRNELTVGFARTATALAFEHLAAAVERPRDAGARHGMARSSLYAALSYATAGLHAVHGLAYALAGLTHRSHGSTNAVFLPYVMDELTAARQVELAEIARLAGAADDAPERLARRAPVLTHALVQRVGLAADLVAFGVSEDQLPRLVADGLAVTRLAAAWPGTGVEEAYQRIVRRAFLGELSGYED